MRIGVDLDNTIVCYDGLFHRLAMERGLIPPQLPPHKRAVRDYLRSRGQESLWTELQGIAYGSRIGEAVPFPGVQDFFAQCRRTQTDVLVISHRTRLPFIGEAVDLHLAARHWIDENRLLDCSRERQAEECVFLELTREAKICRVADLRCDCFIDDLPELLTDEAFPQRVARILFDPQGEHADHPAYRRAASWSEISHFLFGDIQTADRR